jgi:predicted nucleotidyltransferase
MATTLLPREFREFLESLNSNRVEYLLLGGYSVIFYGYTRSTGDIDFWIGVDRKNAARVSKALVDYGFDAEHVSPSIFLRKKKVFRIGVAPLQIDILTDVSGLDFPKCYPRRKVARIDGIKVDIIALKDLKKNKRASGRHKDLDDLENLPRK